MQNGSFALVAVNLLHRIADLDCVANVVRGHRLFRVSLVADLVRLHCAQLAVVVENPKRLAINLDDDADGGEAIVYIVAKKVRIG